MNLKRWIVAMSVAALSACGGGGNLPNGPVVNSPGSGPTQSPTKLVNVSVSVSIPSKSQRRVRPGYISVNTQSLVIELASVDGNGVTGVNPTTIDTVAGAHGCKESAGQLVCSATASGSPGSDVFSVTTYTGTNATGAVLSVGSVSAQIGSGGGSVPISNKLSLSIDGVIAALKLSLSPDSGDRGKAETADVTLIALDASGAQIVGPSDFSAPISLEIQGDTDNAFALHAGGKSGSSLSIVKPTSGITLSYDGNSQASSITVAADVDGPGAINASADFTLKGKSPPPPVGTIYALNLGSNDGLGATVTEYSGKSNGNAAPENTLNLSSKLYARSIAVDSSGNLYVGYFGNQYGFNASDGTPIASNEVAIYAKGASGNATPSAVLNSDPKTQTALFPIFMSLDSSSGLVTYGATDVCKNAGNDAMLIYPAGAKDQVAPADAWGFASPTLSYAGPTGLALDASGNFYVNGALRSTLGPSYGLFIVPASDDCNPAVSPSRTIPWESQTKLEPGETTNVSLADSGEIYIANVELEGSGSYPSCQGRANVFSAGDSGGNITVLRTLTLDTVYTDNSQCDSQRNSLQPFFPTIAVYGSALFVADDFNNAIDEFSAEGNGTVKPSVRITGSSTGLNAPIALVITSVSGLAQARPVHPQ